MEPGMTETKIQYADLNGLVLAGGESSRMKSDKASLIYHEKPQYELLYGLLTPHCNQVFISCKKNRTYPLPCIFDHESVEGPVAGLYSAYETTLSAWLVLAVDYPFFTEKELNQLLINRNPDKPASVFYNPETGYFEPFLGIYEPSFAVILKSALALGNDSMQKILKQNPVQKIIPENPQALTSIDTFQDYLMLKKRDFPFDS